MTEVAPQPEDGRDTKAAALLFVLRDNKPKEAMKLLHEGAGVDFRDPTGRLPLHYAAQNNYTDIIELLLKKDAKTFAWDNNGQTALHKAAIQGHVRSIVTLVARGARVDILDRTGRGALEYAVMHKHVSTVELLCQFGSEPLLLDWSWVKTAKGKTVMYAIAEVIKRQLKYVPGYNHGAIRFDVAVVAPMEGSVQLKNTGVEVKVAEGQELYYVYLSQREETYGTPPILEPDENVFGHLLECQTWRHRGARVETITLTVTVDRALRRNEEVVLRPATKSGHVVVENQLVDGVGITIVTLTVPLETTGMTYFAMVSRMKKELFRISKEAVVLKPENEPDAEIDIPAGTFDSGELSVKFVDTTEAPGELEQGASDAGKSVLMTSIVDLSTTNHKQPKNGLKMKLPVNVKGQSEDVVVLMISNPDPHLAEWKWEKIQAKVDGDGKAVFSIHHFSVCVLTSNSLLDVNPQAAIEETKNTLEKKRKVDFLVAVKTPEVNKSETEMIITCTTKRRMDRKRKRDDEKNYTYFRLGSDTQLPLVPDGQMFQIAIRGKVKDLIDNNNVTLTFNDSNHESALPLAIVSTSDDPNELELSGEVDIFIKTGPDIVPTSKVPTADVGCCWCCFCCFNRRTKETEPNLSTIQEPNLSTIQRASPLCTIPFTVTLTKQDETCTEDGKEENQPMDELERKDKCNIPALMWKNLREAMKMLSPEEARQLGSQLGMRTDVMDTIEQHSSDTDVAFNVIRKWRLRLPGKSQAEQLKHALSAIGKDAISRRMMSQGLEEQRDKGDEE